MSKRKLKINKSLGEYKADTVVFIMCDEDGTPLRKFWRRRLRDAEKDGCVEWADKVAKKRKTSTGDK